MAFCVYLAICVCDLINYIDFVSLQLIDLPKDVERGKYKYIGVDVDFWKKNKISFFQLSLHFQMRNYDVT